MSMNRGRSNEEELRDRVLRLEQKVKALEEHIHPPDPEKTDRTQQTFHQRDARKAMTIHHTICVQTANEFGLNAPGLPYEQIIKAMETACEKVLDSYGSGVVKSLSVIREDETKI